MKKMFLIMLFLFFNLNFSIDITFSVTNLTGHYIEVLDSIDFPEEEEELESVIDTLSNNQTSQLFSKSGLVTFIVKDRNDKVLQKIPVNLSNSCFYFVYHAGKLFYCKEYFSNPPSIRQFLRDLSLGNI